MKFFLLNIFIYISLASTSQNNANRILDLNQKFAPMDSENIYVEKLNSDSLQSSFLIFIRKEVKSHKHINHSESIYVLEGSSKMTIGDTTFTIASGSNFLIPKNTPHKVIVVGNIPLKVLSVQTPFFDGTDRIILEN